MTEAIEHLILEYLRAMRGDLTSVKNNVRELTQRVGRVELALAAIQRDLAHNDEGLAEHGVRLDQLAERIERVERRLEL